MKKYLIRDEDGDKFEVEEIEEKETDEETCHDDGEEVLTVEEMSILKQLIPHVDAILAMVMANKEGTTDEDEEEMVDEEEEVFTDADEDEEVEEKIVETDKKTCDSKRSIGAIERTKKKAIDDSLKDEVADAWNKRYNGR